MKLTQNKISKLPLFKSVCDGNTMQVWMDEKKAEFESAPDI